MKALSMAHRPPMFRSVHRVTFCAKADGKWFECFNNQWIPADPPS
jgi:hypothetical protein